MKEVLGFLPLFIIGVFLVLAGQPSEFVADEQRYVGFARNLINGFYAPTDTLDLTNGPGYPLILAPFVMTGTPVVFARLLNAVLFTLSMVYFFRTLRLYSTRPQMAWVLTYFVGVYIISYGVQLDLLMTEPLSVFLVAAFSFHFCSLHRAQARLRDMALASFFLGWLALTKVFFGYVIATTLVFSATIFVISRTRQHVVTMAACGISLLVCAPYLGYTYSLTGRPFYWGNAGGQSAYWMTTIDEHLVGDWFGFPTVVGNPEVFEKHEALVSRLSKLDFVERDDELWNVAANNLWTHSGNYLKNWRANVNRLVFNYPYSDPRATTGNMAFVYSVLFYLLAFSVYPAIVGRKAIPYEIWALLGFALVALGGISLLSASPRYVVPLIPILALWLCVVPPRVARIELIGNRSSFDQAH